MRAYYLLALIIVVLVVPTAGQSRVPLITMVGNLPHHTYSSYDEALDHVNSCEKCYCVMKYRDKYAGICIAQDYHFDINDATKLLADENFRPFSIIVTAPDDPQIEWPWYYGLLFMSSRGGTNLYTLDLQNHLVDTTKPGINRVVRSINEFEFEESPKGFAYHVIPLTVKEIQSTPVFGNYYCTYEIGGRESAMPGEVVWQDRAF